MSTLYSKQVDVAPHAYPLFTSGAVRLGNLAQNPSLYGKLYVVSVRNLRPLTFPFPEVMMKAALIESNAACGKAVSGLTCTCGPISTVPHSSNVPGYGPVA